MVSAQERQKKKKDVHCRRFKQLELKLKPKLCFSFFFNHWVGIFTGQTLVLQFFFGNRLILLGYKNGKEKL